MLSTLRLGRSVTSTRRALSLRMSMVAAAIAAALATVGSLAGWRGGDLSAQLFRVELFREYGMTLWNPQWYGGHFTLSYSVLYPPIAATAGIAVSTIASATIAAWSFGQLTLRWFGTRAGTGMVLFAIGTGSQVAIGQLPFLMGEAFALAACVAASKQRWKLATAAALAASLTSPLAAAFLVLVIVSWAITSSGHRWLLVVVGSAAALPVAVTAVVFPGTGVFPYLLRDAMLEMAVLATLIAVIPRRHQSLRVGALVYLGAIAASYLVASPIGGNVSRLGESVAVPLAACALWPTRRSLFAAVMVPMVLWQWTPAWPAITNQTDQPSTHAEFYTPLVGFFAALPTPPTRVEVVPTKTHFEVAYVAPSTSLARGWERQIDTADNALFYNSAVLTTSAYRAWLIDTGTQYVAVSDATPDYAATHEADLVHAGMPGLTPVWHNEHWDVYAVDGAQGVILGPAELTSITGDQINVNVTAPGTVQLKFRYNHNWTIEPQPICFGADPSGWITFTANEPGTYRLSVKLTTRDNHPCTTP